MATVPGGTIWTNSDGLRVRFGNDQGKAALEGSPIQSGSRKVFVFDIDYSRFGATGTDTFLNGVPSVALPAGAIVKSAILTTTTAFTSDGSATLSLGVSKQDGTIIDADGIDATIAKTAMDAIGETVTCDGALIDTALAYDSYLTHTVGTAAYTAGRGKLEITLLIPDA